jgi:hypothetical protein
VKVRETYSKISLVNLSLALVTNYNRIRGLVFVDICSHQKTSSTSNHMETFAMKFHRRKDYTVILNQQQDAPENSVAEQFVVNYH